MIFYFSGTGNSKWVAERIADHLGEEVCNIIDEKNAKFSFEKAQRVGIVFPVYAWDAPQVVKNFAGKLQLNGAYAFAVCTCAEESGHTIKKLSKIIPLESGYSISMPSNYMMGRADVENEEVAAAKIEAAKSKIEDICAELKNNAKTFNVTEGKGAFLKSYFISGGFNRFARKTKPFYVNEDLCISCGLCETACPASAIKIKDGKPAWVKEECYKCLSCINRCPQRAIEHGKESVCKGRYYFKESI